MKKKSCFLLLGAIAFLLVTIMSGCVGNTHTGPDQSTLEGAAELYVDAMVNTDSEKLGALLNYDADAIKYFIREANKSWAGKNVEDFECVVESDSKRFFVGHPDWNEAREMIGVYKMDEKWLIESRRIY